MNPEHWNSGSNGISRTGRTLLFIGPILPPLGGVSIHIDRLSSFLADQWNIHVMDESKTIKPGIYNIRLKNPVKYLQLLTSADVVHVHSGTDFLRAFHVVASRILSKKVILTIHAYPEEKTKFRRFLDSRFFNLSHIVIAVNEEIITRLDIQKDKLIIKHAFIPPNMKAEKPLPVNLKKLIDEARKSGKKIISGNAARLDRFNDQDLYGLDLCIDAAISMRHSRVPFLLIYNVAEIDKYEQSFQAYKTRIQNENLSECFLLLNEKISFVNLITESDIIVRPTNTDGDSLTIREALHLKKTVIASDVIKRPPGTILFRNRDSADMTEKILSSIQKAISHPGKYEEKPEELACDFYRSLFVSLLKLNTQLKAK